MMENNSKDLCELKSNLRKYVKINSWGCLAAFIVAVINLVFNIVVEFSDVDTKFTLPFAITMLVLTLICITLIIVSWAKLRKIKRILKQNGIEDIEEEE